MRAKEGFAMRQLIIFAIVTLLVGPSCGCAAGDISLRLPGSSDASACATVRARRDGLCDLKLRLGRGSLEDVFRDETPGRPAPVAWSIAGAGGTATGPI